MKPVYLDCNATTPVDRRVLDAMLPYFTTAVGNAASVDHFYGHEAQQAVEGAREQVAALIGAAPGEIIFTSGATEADNLAILGTVARAREHAEILVSAVEHPAVLEPAGLLGARVTRVPVSAQGIVEPDEVRRRLTPRTALVSVMAANNETGAIQPVTAIGRICAEAGVPFHCDAVQGARHLALDVDEANISLLALSAHKMYGPKGVGALYVRKRGQRMKISPLFHGGGQERNLRPGTANVPGIVGLGIAAELARLERKADAKRETELKRRLMAGLAEVADIQPNAPVEQSLPQTLSARIPGIGARALMHSARADVAFSSGSACTTTKVEASHVLLAQGMSPEAANECVRISFGRLTTDADIEAAVGSLSAAITDLRRIAAAA